MLKCIRILRIQSRSSDGTDLGATLQIPQGNHAFVSHITKRAGVKHVGLVTTRKLSFHGFAIREMRAIRVVIKKQERDDTDKQQSGVGGIGTIRAMNRRFNCHVIDVSESQSILATGQGTQGDQVSILRKAGDTHGSSAYGQPKQGSSSHTFAIRESRMLQVGSTHERSSHDWHHRPPLTAGLRSVLRGRLLPCCLH